MMDLATIKAVNKEKTELAKQDNIQPFIIESQGQIDNFKNFPFMHIGDHVPEGWELVNTYFVDASGFGADDEAALSINQFLNKLRVGFGYAVTESGQFQVYVGEFKRVENE